MCGIVGFVDKKRQLSVSEKRELLERMLVSIEHRGRDGGGIYVEDDVAMGNARLAIIDPTERGNQPFFDTEKSLVLTYVGEIYNFRQVNRSLKSANIVGTSDTETIMYAFKERGVSCLQNLKGMFSFSIYDKRQKKVTLCIDRFGIKPLYIIDTDDWFAWSSEVKALLLLPGFSAKLSESALSEFFVFRQVGGDKTLFKDVERVLPAHVVEFDCASHRRKDERYWHLTGRPIEHVEDEAQMEKELESRLRTAVREHLVADVPVGLQLSGGVDSSLVAALATEEKTDVHTYSIGLADSRWNEFQYSRSVAERYGTHHHELLFTEEDFCKALPQLTYMHDEPISHSHSVPMHLLAREARKDVKVLLSGEGADEIFFGYKRYLSLAERELTDEDVLYSSAFIDTSSVQSFFPAFSRDDVSDFRKKVVREARNGEMNWTQVLSQYDLATYLTPLLLRQDKMGMAANLENRVPFLDHELATFGFSLPVQYKIVNGVNKVLLKKVAERFLPHDLIYRPKCGFAQPIAEWLRNESGFGRFLSLVTEGKRAFLDKSAITSIIAEHRGKEKEHTEILWTLINLEIWMRIFIDNQSPDSIFSELYA